MVSANGFGFFSDFAVIYRWAGGIWQGIYVGQYPFPLVVLCAPISLLPLDFAAVLWFSAILLILVLTLKRESLYWMFFAPFLQVLFLGQLDPLFWLIYRSRRPAVWALLTLKPQFLLPALPRIFASRRTVIEFVAATAALHLPFLLIRPTWPIEWIRFLSTYEQNRLTRVPSATVSGEILVTFWILPFAACLALLFVFRRRNLEGLLFLANPLLLPYDYSLLMGGISKLVIPLSWLALWGAWQVKAGWPYALMLMAVLLFETIRARRAGSGEVPKGRLPVESSGTEAAAAAREHRLGRMK